MKADPDLQRRLLDLQAIDTSLARLAHRRRTLPELAELDRLARELSALEDERLRAQVSVDDFDRDIARLEKDIEQVRSRANRDRARLDAGTGPARELEALQHELATLARRKSELEDAELALMERREEAQASLDGVSSRLDALRTARAEAELRRDAAVRDLDRDRDWRTSSRTPLVADLPTDLVALYERTRQATGIGAAMLRAGGCEGCRLELSGSELSRFRSADPSEVMHCEECGRILVRTAESGL